MLPVSVARTSSGTFTIGRVAYRWEEVFFRIDNVYTFGTTRVILTKVLMHVAYVCGFPH